MNSKNKLLIKVNDLTSVYIDINGKHQYILRDIDFNIIKGKTLGIIGESGSGKTQLMYSILGIKSISPGIVGGNVEFIKDGKNISIYEDIHIKSNDKNNLNEPLLINKEARKLRELIVGFIPQDPKAYLNPFWSIKELFRLTYKKSNNQMSIDIFIDKYLLDVGIDKSKLNRIKNQKPNELSGGEAQRVMNAFILSKQVDILIADEPTTGVDVTTQKRIIETIDLLKKHKQTIIIISHDFGFLDHVVDEFFILYNGFLCEYINSKEKIYSHSFKHPYTKVLIESLTQNKKNVRTVSNKTNYNSCPFIENCKLYISIESEEIKEKCQFSLPDKIYDKDESNWVRCWGIDV